jgi:Ca-activated chloride channel homolog
VVAKLRIMPPHPGKNLATRTCAAAAVTFACLAVASGQQPGPTFKSGTRIVPLNVTVTDADHRLVPDLLREDFEILDNDKPQPLVVFENGTLPVTVAVMLDTSASMTGNLKLLSLAAEQFLLRLLPEDKGRVGAFNDKVGFVTDFTSDRDRLIASLRDLDFGNPTRLYDAISLGVEELAGVDGRRVVLVFTDGDDTSSRANLGNTIDRAREKDVMVYAIGLESEYAVGGQRVRTRPDRGLRKIADETGGGYFELSKADELSSTFTRVAQEIHSQYVLGFSPAALDGKVHKLAVRVKKPGMTVRTRKSYLAAAEKPTTDKP